MKQCWSYISNIVDIPQIVLNAPLENSTCLIIKHIDLHLIKSDQQLIYFLKQFPRTKESHGIFTYRADSTDRSARK